MATITIETKYNVGDTVWCMFKDQPAEVTIESIDGVFSKDKTPADAESTYWRLGNRYWYRLRHFNTGYYEELMGRKMDESTLFPSKKALLNSL